jgi:uncharacterized protein (DUF983 family)
MVLTEIAKSVATNCCPRCHSGKMFLTNNPYSYDAFKMHDTCACCHLKYEMEPGFFYGAMYVSYALTSGIFIVWFFVNHFLMDTTPGILITLVISSILLLFPVLYRTARLIWINFFVRYDAQLKLTQNSSSSSHQKQ